jgi:hypothetical protein
VRWDVETLINIPMTMIIGIALVIFAFNLALPISKLSVSVARGTLGIALACVLLSFMMMITRSKAVPQVIGFLSMENGLFFAATSATYGMPMVVELGIALDVLVGILILGVFMFHIREAVRQPRHQPPRKAQGRLTGNAVFRSRHSLARQRGSGPDRAPRQRARGQRRLQPGDLRRHLRADRRGDLGGPLFAWQREFYIDPLNVFLVTLTAFVGLTTAIFSRPYMRVERDHGKMTPNRMRLYHSMYQLFSFTMLLALTTNNLGILWVAMEAATLTTVLLVSVYRTPASLEAAWKYFILCGVGIAQALFGTVLLYMAAEKVIGTEGGALLWTNLDAVKAQLDPTIITLAFAFLFIGYGTKVGLVPMHNWLPDAHAEGPTPVSAVLSGLLLNVAVYALLRCKVLTDGALQQPLAGQLMMGFRAAVGGRGGVLPVAAEGRQAHVRLFVDRTHGADHLRLRHGRADCQLCRPAAHDGAFADQVGNLLCRRPRDAEGRDAEHGRHPRPDQGQPDGRLGPDARLAGHPRHAALSAFSPANS